MRKKEMALLIGVGVCACVGGFSASSAFATSDPALITELFLPSAMVLEPMQTDSDLLYFEKGIRLQTQDVTAEAVWKETVSGEFSFQYLPTGESASSSTLEITFKEEESAESFTLVVEHGATKNAYVRFNGVEAGVFYYRQGSNSGLTELCNAEGKYTQFTADKMQVVFDPSEMTVSIGGANGMQLLVWDMLTPENDGCDVGETLTPFRRYSVSFSMPKYAEESSAIILYQVNGYTLDGLLLDDSGQPTVFADFEKDALVGQPYTLPKGYAYDVKDGALATQVSVYDGSGEIVANNTASFIPKKQGVYTVKYTAKNSDEKTAERSYALNVYERIPDSKYTLEWNLDREQALGQRAFIPELTLYGGLCRYGSERGTLSVTKDGISLLAYKNIRSGFYFTFSSVGNYVFTYRLGESTLSYEVSVEETENKFIVNGLKEKYVKNSIVDCRDSYLIVNGEQTEFSFTVEYPDGRKYKDKKFQADILGEYLLCATATVNGEEYSFEKTFTVTVQTVDLFSSLASDIKVGEGKSSFTGRSGAMITAKRASVVEYTQPIDITKYVDQTQRSSSGTIVLSETAKPLIEFSVDPEGYKSAAATGVNVYITDAKDPNNKLTVNIASCNSLTWSYIRASAPGQTLTGFENNVNGTLVINNAVGNLRTSNFGFMIQHSFAGALTGEQTTSQSKISLYYDNETKQLLSLAGGASATVTHLVMDFDDPAFSGKTWDGFTSDKVYISFAIANFSAGEAKTIVYSIDGVDLSAASAIGSGVPTIKTETDSLVGLKGASLAVPTAKATDAFGQEILNTVRKVYYEKDGEYFDVSVKDGRFNTQRSGRYVIVYTATDAFGRIAEKCIEVEVLEQAEEFSAETEIANEYKKCAVGVRCNVYLPTVDDVAGGIGKIGFTWKILHEGICVAENVQRFKPEQGGVYTVEYTFTDSVDRTATLSYDVTVEVPQEPVIISEIPYFVGFVRGNTYDIPEVHFIDYTKETAVTQKAEIYLDGVLFTGNRYTPDHKVQGKDEAEENTKLLLEYRYGAKVLLSYEIPLKTVYRAAEKKIGALTIDVTEYLYERYFVTAEQASVRAKNDHLAFYAQSEGAGFAFAQPLSTQTLRFALDVDFERAADLSPVTDNLKAVQITIVDAKDSAKSVELLLHTDEATGLVRMSVNGKEVSNTFKGSLLGVCTELIEVGYNAEKKAFYDGNTSAPIIAPTEYKNGEPFDGFNEFVYLSIYPIAYDTQEEVSLRLYSLNGQTFNNSSSEDTGAPALSVMGSVSGVYEMGALITVYPASATDVLSDIAQVYVTVTCTHGEQTDVVKDVDGLPLEEVSADKSYSFRLTQIGDYRITYFVKDSRQGETSETYVVTAAKRTDPVISLSASLPNSVKVGDEVKVPSASVTFMEESEENLHYIVCITPENEYEMIKEGSFKASVSGIYKIRYYALDKYGNYTIQEYTLPCYE